MISPSGEWKTVLKKDNNCELENDQGVVLDSCNWEIDGQNQLKVVFSQKENTIFLDFQEFKDHEPVVKQKSRWEWSLDGITHDSYIVFNDDYTCELQDLAGATLAQYTGCTWSIDPSTK